MNSRDTFETSYRRIREAIKLGTMDAREERHLTWTPLLLDRIGWQTVVAGIGGLSRHVADERIAAASRMARCGEQPIPVTVVLAAFESPPGPSQVRSPDEGWLDPIAVPAGTVDVPPSFSSEAQALANPLRLDIMEAASKRPVSPASFFAKYGGGSVADVGRHFEALRGRHWLRLVKPLDGRGSLGRTEHLYRTNKAPVFDTDVWSAMPGSVQAVVNAWILESYSRRVGEAMEADTLDAREDRRFSCATVPLDRLGWEKLIARTDTLFKFLFGEQARTKQRLAHSSEEPFFATVVLMAFESPGGPPKPPRFLGDLPLATGR
jgi:DNA-binding transcriptional ArsR family regulator